MAREIIGYRTNRRGRRVAIYGDSNPSVNTNVTPKPVETLTEGGDQPVLKNKNTNTNNRTQNKPKAYCLS